ncbi:MAG: S9 family peptidase [Bacteroidales bacterium]|nr:S9 family peptidase [Bacteroidales bacterium]
MKRLLQFLPLLFLFAFTLHAQDRIPNQLRGQLRSTQRDPMTPETLWEFDRVSDAKLSPDGKFVLYGITSYELSTNKGKRNLFILDMTTQAVSQLTDEDDFLFNAVWRPDGQKIGYISSKSGSAQFWEMNPDGSDKKQITEINDGIDGFIYAPALNYILFTKKVKLEQTANEFYPDLPLADARIIDDLMYRHWNAWSDYSYSHIFVAPYSEGRIGIIKDIMEHEKYHAPLPPGFDLTQIAFSPDGKKIAYTSKKMNGKAFAISTDSDIYIYDIEAGNTKNISQGMTGYDKNPVFSNSGEKIAWSSMATPGFEADKERIIVYDFRTERKTDLTENFDQSSSNLLWSDNDNEIYFISGINATYQLYKIDVASKSVTQITRGRHDITAFERRGRTIIAEIMSMSLPTEIFSINEVTGQTNQISYTNKAILDRIQMGRVEERWIKTTDNKNMLVWVIYPPNFDPNRIYPALLYCQGGPQSAVSQFFSYRWNFQMMAANDYIVVVPNRRGLPTFGQAWNDQISGDYGGQNMQDYLSAIDSLAKEPFIDENRLGAVGASYGGFSVYWLAGNHNKRFKAFIAHCGMFNFESWYGSTEEMFFANHDLGGAYWENETPKSYDFSPHNFLGNWDTPILVIHGGKDFRIPYTEGMQAFNAAQLQDIPSRFLFFPNETHFVTKPQNSVLWQREFFRWLDNWLK